MIQLFFLNYKRSFLNHINFIIFVINFKCNLIIIFVGGILAFMLNSIWTVGYS
jgi:hypothetical protein